LSRELYATTVLPFRQPQLRWSVIHPYAKQAFLRFTTAGGGYAIAGTIVSISKRIVLGHDQQGQPDPPQGYLAVATRKINAIVKPAFKPPEAVSRSLYPDVRYSPGKREHQPAATKMAPHQSTISAGDPIGKAHCCVSGR